METSENPALNIVVPVYNEKESFPNLYEELKEKVKTPFSLIVVYDFKEDNTLPVAKKISAKDKRVRLVKNKRGRGALNAILSGFDEVKSGPLLVVMADLSDDIKIIDDMYGEYLKGAKVVCGSRYMKGGSQIGGPLVKKTLSRIAGVTLYVLTRIPTHDVTNSFKLYDKAFIDSINIESSGGFEIGMEITVKAYKNKQKIVEIPSKWLDRANGESNFKLWSWLPSYIKWYLYALI